MITAIEIENFKAVGSPGVRVEIRPITLLFGPNSIGKSTVIQALQYARDVLLYGKADIDRMQLGGESIDLGGFQSAVHRRDLRRLIKVRLTVDCRAEVFPTYADSEQGEDQETDLRQLVTGGLRLDYRDPATGKQMSSLVLAETSVEVAVGWDELESAPRVMSFAVAWDGVPFVRIEARVANAAPAILINHRHSLLAAEYGGYSGGTAPLEDVRSLSEEFLRPPGSPVEGAAEDWWEGQLVALSAVPQRGRRLRLQEVSFEESQQLLEAKYSRDAEGEANWRATRQGLVALTAAVLTPLELVLRHLTPLRYVGPLRRVPDRDFRPCLTPAVERWNDGLGAWDALHVGFATLVADTSAWLAGEQALDTGYSLEVREVIELDAPEFRNLARRGELVEAVAKLEQIILTTYTTRRLSLVELRTKIRLEPKDLGVGISQVVPVVVAALAPGSNLVAIEQPELHVHPKVQLGLGKLIIEAATDEERPVTLILETHSEHIALVLLRRIEKTANDTLPEGEEPLRAAEVAFYSITMGKDGELAASLHEVNARGDFESKWPGGFFEERGKVLFE